jgi:phytoene synthase
MREAFDYCEQQVREADKDRFLATLFAPADKRAPLYALYAFDNEIAHVRDRISSPLPGEVRLQWWRDVLTDTARGDAGANPVAAALIETVRRFALPVPTLLDLIDAHTFDLYDEPMATLADLERYAAATSAGALRLAALMLNGGEGAGCGDAIHHAGIALAMTDILFLLPLHAARGQLYLPGDILAAHAAQPHDIFAGRSTGALNEALAELRAIVRSHLESMRASAKDIPREILPALLPLALVPSRLARLERDDPFRPTVVPQWRRQWFLWRAARQPARFLD